MASFQIKRITLPSGKVVEIVYLAPAPQTVIAGPETAELSHVEFPHVRRIELCPACGGDRVHPLDWHEVSDMRWQLVVRCPDCRWRTSDVFEQPEVERYDDVLAADTDRLIEVLDRVTRENMTEQLERFRRALEHDAIEPMDF
jgi:hypothetical protein